MLELTASEVYNSAPNITNDNDNLQISKRIKKRGKRCSLGDLEMMMKKFQPADLKDELLSSVIIDKVKEIEFDDLNILKKLQLTGEGIESIGTSDIAKESVFDKRIKEYEQSIFLDIESFLRTMRSDEEHFFSFYRNKNLFLRLVKYHWVYGVSGNFNTLDETVKAFV